MLQTGDGGYASNGWSTLVDLDDVSFRSFRCYLYYTLWFFFFQLFKIMILVQDSKKVILFVCWSTIEKRGTVLWDLGPCTWQTQATLYTFAKILGVLPKIAMVGWGSAQTNKTHRKNSRHYSYSLILLATILIKSDLSISNLMLLERLGDMKLFIKKLSYGGEAFFLRHVRIWNW
jgi:hypothetical protein